MKKEGMVCVAFYSPCCSSSEPVDLEMVVVCVCACTSLLCMPMFPFRRHMHMCCDSYVSTCISAWLR